MSFDTSLVCREKHHASELLNLFCEQCKVCICKKCGQTRHNHHIKVDIDQAAKECKVNIEEIAEEMKKEAADFQLQVKRYEEKTRKSREEIAAARNKALTSLEELMRVLKEYETTTMSKLDVIEQREVRGNATQLEHFQTSIDQLQKSVEYCEDILQRNKSIEILQVHQTLVERCKGLLNVEKLNMNKLLHTTLQTRYEINEELVETLRCAVPGRLLVSNTTDHLQSVAEGKGLKEADVGNKAEFLITTKDFNQKQCYDEDDQIIVKVKTPSGEKLNNEITHRKDGEYRVTYTPDCVGTHNVVIEVNGQPLTGSPWSLHVSPHHYRPLFSFGSRGKGQEQFSCPCDIAVDENTRNIAVADRYNRRVQLFNSEGKYLNTVSHKELKPISVAFTWFQLIVIADRSTKIFRFDERRKLVSKITNKHLKKPVSLTIARGERMVVCDEGDFTVKVLSPNGKQLLLTISDPDHSYAAPYKAISHQGIFIVCYSGWTENVKVFSKDGVFLHNISTHWSGDGQLWNPAGIDVDRFSNLVVCDAGNRSLKIFTLDGKFVSKIETPDTGLGDPDSVAVSPTGQLCITDKGQRSHCVHVFQ